MASFMFAMRPTVERRRMLLTLAAEANTRTFSVTCSLVPMTVRTPLRGTLFTLPEPSSDPTSVPAHR